MKFDVLTLFPEMFEPVKQSILGRAEENKLIEVNLINIRDFSENKHKKVDDTPYGGGAGMVMQADVIYNAYKSIKKTNAKVIYMSPQGQVLNQKKVEGLSKEEHLIILCGHYEGVDQRILDKIVDEEISIGNYVLTGGELPAMVLIDSVSRYVDGVLSNDSTSEESFSQGILEYPQYTRPETFEGVKVPEILQSGHHENINKWRRYQALKNTYYKRPELLENVELSEKDKRYQAIADQFTKNTVIVTYTGLADQTEALVEKLKALKADKTDDNVKSVCETFLNARAWWEKSEAFLFGAASDFGIDPHIDSWPLDLDGLLDEMKNTSHITAMEAEDADVWAGVKLGPELLGFHGIEYIIFEAGSPKAVSKIKDKELTYAIAVAGDLRNKCYQLQISWAGVDNVDANRVTKVVDELEWNTTVAGGENSYTQNMMLAGQVGSTYTSWTGAMQAIIDGCKTIADEVGTSKIGKPHTGEDKNYIESPYSYNSITDFYDNIISIQNAYMGGIEGQRDESKSLHNYMASVNADLDTKMIHAITSALTKIKAMKAPFVLNYTDDSCQEAMDACKALDDVLTEVKAELAK